MLRLLKLTPWFLLSALVACSETPESRTAEQQSRIDAQNLSEIVKTLASDEFQGRAPGGPGEEKTVSYLIEQFSSLGLKPGGENGGWTQAVPLIHTQLESGANARFKLAANDQRPCMSVGCTVRFQAGALMRRAVICHRATAFTKHQRWLRDTRSFYVLRTVPPDTRRFVCAVRTVPSDTRSFVCYAQCLQTPRSFVCAHGVSTGIYRYAYVCIEQRVS